MATIDKWEFPHLLPLPEGTGEEASLQLQFYPCFYCTYLVALIWSIGNNRSIVGSENQYGQAVSMWRPLGRETLVKSGTDTLLLVHT